MLQFLNSRALWTRESRLVLWNSRVQDAFGHFITAAPLWKHPRRSMCPGSESGSYSQNGTARATAPHHPFENARTSADCSAPATPQARIAML
jgi:hypothetical protein